MKSHARYRVVVVGAGQISPFHIAAIRRISGAEIVALVDLDTDRAQRLAERMNIRRVAANLDELSDDHMNVVHVATPPHTHFDVTCQALRLGCDVFVEKPLASSTDECDRIASLAEDVGRQVCVNHSNLRDPFVAKTLRMIQSGRIGKVVSAAYLRSSTYPPYEGGPLPPHYREGGFPFRDIGVHALYLLREILGEIRDVESRIEHRGDDHNLSYDQWHGLAACEQGTGYWHLSWNVRPVQSVLIVEGTQGVVRCDPFSMYVTSKRSTRLPKFVERVVHSVAEAGAISTQVPWQLARFVAGRIKRYHGIHATIEAFYESLRNERPVPVPVHDAKPIVHWTEHVARQADAEKRRQRETYSRRKQADVLVTGATGFIGRHLLERLLQTHDHVRILVRREPPEVIAQDNRIDVVLGDLGDPAAVDEAVRGVDLVYHVGAAMTGPRHDFQRGTEVGTRNVVQSILRHAQAKLVYVSSLSVLHAAKAKRGDVITEDWPLEPHPEKRGHYTLFKLRAEQTVTSAVKNDGLQAIILRPGQVFGPGAEILTPAVARCVGNRLIVLGDGTVPLPLIYVDDVVDALLAAADRGPFDGTILHVVDDTVEVDQNRLLRRLHDCGFHDATVVRIPRILVNGLAAMVQIGFFMLRRPAPLNLYRVRSALSPLKFDCRRVRRDFGWKCNVGVSFGLESILSDAEESSNDVAATSKLNGSWNLEPVNELEPDEVSTGGHSGA